ncbi:hypothetical protein MFIFM68171_09569 [Madurella fahalii]|uniref:Uncharacterized protein n=1 Tax=Madurella fahalii TaxID=1157608 RepID=A0ABQ0GNN3_9PEZI
MWWCDSLHPIRVDIVGDFAGRGLFAIHGEALLTYCLEHARVGFSYGFQLLHAVHAVETFLAKLRDRGCIFNALWFEEDADICMPAEARMDNLRASKYRLARAVLIQHFSCPVSRGQMRGAESSYLFPSLESGLFHKYLDSNPLHFFLGSNAHHDGLEGSSIHEYSTPLEILHKMTLAGYYTYLPMTTPRSNSTPLPVREEQHPFPPTPPPIMAQTMKRLAETGIAEALTAREFISICALSSVLSSPGTKDNNESGMPPRQVVAVLLHLALLRHCGLPQRSFAKQEPSAGTAADAAFLTKFFEAAREGLEVTMMVKLLSDLSGVNITKPPFGIPWSAADRTVGDIELPSQDHLPETEFMSDTIAYSASLTGASGKNIELETIVVCNPIAKGGKPVKEPHSTTPKEKRKESEMTKDAPKSNK